MSTCHQQSEDGEVNIQKLLWRLRTEDPTQYFTLVKMHLSFATDIPTHQCDGRPPDLNSNRRWQLTPLMKRLVRNSATSKGVMEGVPLSHEGVCQAFQLIHYLNKDYNITQEGIFRKSGSLSRQQELKSLLNSGGDLNLDYGTYSAHDCASVLKSFLADLPEPLLTEGHYSIHCKIADMLQSNMSEAQKDAMYNRQIKSLRLLFLLLPPENYRLLQDLLILLNRVAEHQKQNLMSAINLGTMFAPHILCPRKMNPNDLQYLSGTLSTAVAFMIEHVPQIFQIPLELEYDVRQYWNNKKTMKHQVSKRSMMDAPTNTVYTFIDRELTAQANDKDVTEVALAELYAYVQSLPDSAKKRRLIKQFNNASGTGTPQLNNSFSKKSEARTKKLGDSIKKVIMTPRSRCPIIVNSTTSLSSVTIPEERGSFTSPVTVSSLSERSSCEKNVHTTPIIANPLAKLDSPRKLVGPLLDTTNHEISYDPSGKKITKSCINNNESCKEEKQSRWSSSSLRRTLSSASSTTSLFGNFFRHLSTSSLSQLATRLTSSSVPDSETQNENELSTDEESFEEPQEDMNESLSNVFKDYLLSRSILTDNPIDLSTYCQDEDKEDEKTKVELSESSEEHGDSAYSGSQPTSKCVSRQCSKGSLRSVDSAIDVYTSTDLSESLLYCLDGNDPSSPNEVSDSESHHCRTQKSKLADEDELSTQSIEKESAGLHSCSPDSRQHSLLKTKQGTPVPQRDREHTDASSARGILFETSL